jgi:N-methylhydantoinase A/oxoprolinase/acetone carboxylase beta subunit
VATPRFDGLGLPAGAAVSGPAVIEMPATTIVIPPHCQVTRTPHGHLLIEPTTEGDS